MTDSVVQNPFRNTLARLRALGAGLVWRGGGGTGLIHLDRSGQIISANAIAARLFARVDLAGIYLQTLCETRDRTRIDEALGATSCGPVLVKTMSDPACYLELLFERRGDGGLTAIALDRTAAEETAAALRAETDAALKKADNAEKDAQVNADLLADLSHEMRTPLNAVIGFADAMRNETFGPLGSEKYDEYVGHIRNSGAHLMDLISAILDLARKDAGRLTLKRTMIDCGVLAHECGAMVRGAAEDAGLSLELLIDDDLPESWLDARSVRQILINLLTNAVKFTSDGGVTLRVKQEGDAIVASVIDTGVGMNEEELARLGSRFTSVHGEGVRGAGGAGLGLALAFALTEAHGGAMSLKSAPGEGVEATVRLPILNAPARAASEEDKASDDVMVHSQLDRIDAYRREIAAKKNAA